MQLAVNKTLLVAFVEFFPRPCENLVKLLRQRFLNLGLRTKGCHEMSWEESTVSWTNHPLRRPIEILLNQQTNDGRDVIYSRRWFGKNLEWWKWIKQCIQLNLHGGRMREIVEFEIPYLHRKWNLFKI